MQLSCVAETCSVACMALSVHSRHTITNSQLPSAQTSQCLSNIMSKASFVPWRAVRLLGEDVRVQRHVPSIALAQQRPDARVERRAARDQPPLAVQMRHHAMWRGGRTRRRRRLVPCSGGGSSCLAAASRAASGCGIGLAVDVPLPQVPGQPIVVEPRRRHHECEIPARRTRRRGTHVPSHMSHSTERR